MGNPVALKCGVAWSWLDNPMPWKRGTFPITVYWGEPWMKGYVRRWWGIDRRARDWWLTHIPTGMCVLGQIRTLGEMQHVADLLDATGIEWHRYSKRYYKRRDVRAKVKNVIAALKGPSHE